MKVDEGWDRIVERRDETDVAALRPGPDAGGHFVRTLLAAKRVNAAHGGVGVIVADNVVAILFNKQKGGHGIIPCRLGPDLPALLVVGDDFIVRTGRAQPRVMVFPARPPGMSRRDLIGMK